MLVAVLLLVGACAHDGADAGQPYPWGDDDDDADIYDHYDEKVVSSSSAMTPTHETQYTRVRRNDQTTSPVRTLSSDEIREVKGVLNKIMAGRDLRMFTPESVTDLRRLMDLMSSPTPDFMSELTQFTPLSTPRDKEIDNIARTSSENVTINGWVFGKYKNKYITYPKTLYPLITDQLTQAVMDDAELTCLQKCTEDIACKTVVLDKYNYQCNYFRFDKNKENVVFASSTYYTYYERLGQEPTTTPEPTTVNYTTTIEMTTEPQIIDIRRLVAIIANLTMNTIESNLTELFNATLQKYGIPMCGDTTTTEEPTYDFANATIVSKCFVCGMDTPGIPHNAYCADAFAGDFLPLVPVDPRAKGQIARYRKYCRYLDVPGTIINETQPRSVFGRWTGGCSVRWIDLSGVYTQRACRNRRHAAMGRHYVSKRMAKLEMALKNEDNGCIISPMSSLVPLSRGISLYARFHACVCVGNWCNSAPPARTRVPHAYLMLLAAFTAMALASWHLL